MAIGSYTNKQIKPIENYKEAEERYNSIKPIRGSEDIRPLGPRRYNHIRIEKWVEGDQTLYGTTLYKTRLITYYPDNSMKIQNGGWGTATTQGVFNEVLPYGLLMRGCKTMRLEIKAGTMEINGEYLLPKEGLALAPDYLPLNPMNEKTYRVNRTKNKEVMRQYSDFMAWVKGYLSLRENTFDLDEVHDVLGITKGVRETQSDLWKNNMFNPRTWFGDVPTKTAARQALLNMMVNNDNEDKYEKFIQATMVFSLMLGTTVWRTIGTNNRILTLDNIKKGMIKLHAPEIIEEIAVPVGKAANRSPYATWMDGWIKDAYTTSNTTTTA